MSIIRGGVIKVKSFRLSEAKIYIHILPEWQRKLRYTIPDTIPQTKPVDTSSSFNLALSSYSIINSKLVYKDESSKMLIVLDHFDHSGSGNFDLRYYDLKTRTVAEAVTFNYSGMDYLSKVKTNLDAVLNII